MKRPIIFTDLDGTLLNYSEYSFAEALPALQLVKDKDVPLILCSSKTRKEIELYRVKLGIDHPFISENGGGIFIPEDYFKLGIDNFKFQIEKELVLIRLGAEYSKLRKALQELRAEGFDVRGFGDMTTKDIADATGQCMDEAELAKERDFDEPFIYSGSTHKLPLLINAITAKGFHYTKGKLSHITGDNDKGKAVAILTDLYKKKYGEIITIGIGDSPNDIPMLMKVARPVIVQQPDGKYDVPADIPGLIKAAGIGPVGWNRIILKLIG
ncbi:MAG: HAD-IIB family hydrolase [Nitrospiraceae bacterium]|nr:MAG: HAD-IIB family hydrolase [Nitrospiraceae bacterium]